MLGLVALLVAQATTAADDEPLLSRPIDSTTSAAARNAIASGGEVVRLHWKIGGFLGAVAGLFLPNKGEGVLTFVPEEDERMRIQLLITAPKREGEYFLYGAEVNARSGSTLAAWSSQSFRGERKDREEKIDAPSLIDYASAIYRLRWNPPTRRTRMTIWSSGKTYPVDLLPLGVERRKIGGEKIEVRGYAVRGAVVDGERSFDDKIDIYFANDERATPVEIVGKRGMIRTRIRMTGAQGQARPPLAPEDRDHPSAVRLPPGSPGGR